VSPKFNERGGGSGILIKTHAFLNASDLSPEFNDPGPIPDPPGHSTFNEGGGGGSGIFSRQKTILPKFTIFCLIYHIFFRGDSEQTEANF
jgi:hypothetical protein